MKSVCELIAPPRALGRKPPPAVLVEHIQGHALGHEDQVVVSHAIHGDPLELQHPHRR